MERNCEAEGIDSPIKSWKILLLWGVEALFYVIAFLKHLCPDQCYASPWGCFYWKPSPRIVGQDTSLHQKDRNLALAAKSRSTRQTGILKNQNLKSLRVEQSEGPPAVPNK